MVGRAALLILINGVISVLLRLDLGRRLRLAAICITVQLILVGLVLEWVFRVDRWYVVLALVVVMNGSPGDVHPRFSLRQGRDASVGHPRVRDAE